MKILVIASSWNDQNAVGNTYSNWFGGEEWSDDEFACLCFRMQEPSNSVCKKYYRFTDIENLKKIFLPQSIGEYFNYENSSNANGEAAVKEKKLITTLHSRPHHFVYFVQEVLRTKGMWVNRRFKEFLTSFSPDIIFTTIDGVCMPKALYKCIRTNTNAKIVLYASDDMVGKYMTFPFYRRAILLRGYANAIKYADKLYGASTLLCAEYGIRFQKNIVPLYKGCEVNDLKKSNSNDAVRFVYAGNLLYGRADTLAVLAKCISEQNRVGANMMLEIYTGTEVKPNVAERLNISGASAIMGSRPYSEIKKIMNCADVVLHVESFEKKQIDYVHYSFSTKIMDCLQSGTATLAIGPAGIASIEYLRNIPGVRTVDSPESIQTAVHEIYENRGELLCDASMSREYAMRFHDMHAVRSALRKDFDGLIRT